jgi:stearoyl-CoA desaturase (delta-9 desaturase)
MTSHFLKLLFPLILLIAITFCTVTLSIWFLLYVIIGYIVIGVIGNMIGYHRYLSHKSFKLNKFFNFLIIYLGTLSGHGSPLFWVALHRHHHKYSDTDNDLHSPKNGIWESTLKWQIIKTKKIYNITYPRDLCRDNYLMFIHKYYYVLYWSSYAFLSLISYELAFGLLIGGTLITSIMSIIGNYILHNEHFGEKTHQTNDNSKNVFIMNLLTFGGGFHNNHHAFPSNFRYSSFDLSADFIELIRKD